MQKSGDTSVPFGNLTAPSMKDEITIRNCTKKDAEKILALAIRTFRDTFDESNTPENMMLYITGQLTLPKIKEALEEKGSVFFLAEKAGQAVGYARVRQSPLPEGFSEENAIEIERLYVDKKFIGKRVGYLLMNSCLRHATRNGFKTVWLGVWEHNTRALAFYEKWGFQKFGHHTFMLGNDAQTDLLMKKII